MATKGSVMSAENVVELLELCTTEQDWEDACRLIKDDNDGEYPGFWLEKVLMSGVAERVRAQWPAF